MEKELLQEFVEWLENNSNDVYWVFESTNEAINKFLKQRN